MHSGEEAEVSLRDVLVEERAMQEETYLWVAKKHSRAVERPVQRLVYFVVHGWSRLQSILQAWRAEAELHELGARELGDLGLDRGGIPYAVRYGRDRPDRPSPRQEPSQ